MAINFKRLENIASAMKPLHQDGRSFHVTFAYNGSKLLTIGTNQYSKSHKYHKFGHYVSRYHEGFYQSGIHSEVMAITKLGLDDYRNITFVNIRIDNNNKCAISKPCKNCERILSEFGYRYLYYYDGQQYVKQKYKL